MTLKQLQHIYSYQLPNYNFDTQLFLRGRGGDKVVIVNLSEGHLVIELSLLTWQSNIKAIDVLWVQHRCHNDKRFVSHTLEKGTRIFY